MTAEPALPNRSPTYWWLASLASPVLGLVLEALSTYGQSTGTIGWLAFALCLAVGLFACLHSFKTKERFAPLSLISGVLSGLLLLGIVALIVWSLIMQTSAHRF